LLLFGLNLIDQLLNFALDVLEKRLEKGAHERAWQLDIGCPLYLHLKLRKIFMFSIVSFN